MADSALQFVEGSTWTEIAIGPLTDCLVTMNRGGFYLYAADQPVADFGHAIDQFENVNAVPEADQSFWILCPFGDAEVWVTEREVA